MSDRLRSASIGRRLRFGLPLHGDHRNTGDQEPDQHRSLADERHVSTRGVETGLVGSPKDRGSCHQIDNRTGVGHPSGPPGEHSSGQRGVGRRGQQQRRHNEPNRTVEDEAALPTLVSSGISLSSQSAPRIGQWTPRTRCWLSPAVRRRAACGIASGEQPAAVSPSPIVA
jgi:hypothetical protein